MDEEKKSNPQNAVAQEETLEFEFEDLLNEDSKELGPDSDSDDDIIELVDIVEEDLVEEELEDRPIKFPDEVDKGFELMKSMEKLREEGETVSLSGLEGVSTEEDESLISPELESEAEDSELKESVAQDLELDLEPPISELESEKDLLEGEPITKEVEAKILDEEKLEQLVTDTVERVVERVARQTMAEVAERVIKEAIDALKESLEERS